MSEARSVSAGVAAFDALSPYEASVLLETCCGASAWVEGMTLRRPFGTLHVLLHTAEELWWSLTPDDWREVGSRTTSAADATAGA